MSVKPELRSEVEQFCAEVGADPLLVQGAGGNASWKQGDTLWVKASGTWLADAEHEDIFVPVDLNALRASIALGDFSAKPQIQGTSTLRPSIETMFHGLLPHRVVVHLHAVEILAQLVRRDFEAELMSALGSDISWAVVGYHKPGADLALALQMTLAQSGGVNVVFLKNHGVVIGGADVEEIRSMLQLLTDRLASPADSRAAIVPGTPPVTSYEAVEGAAVQRIALDHSLFGRLDADWVLYPDHVVFLGPTAFAYESWSDFQSARTRSEDLPELIFVKNEGVYATSDFTTAKKAQLGCYADVISRQQPEDKLDALSGEQIAELLDWDAEKYRIQIARR